MRAVEMELTADERRLVMNATGLAAISWMVAPDIYAAEVDAEVANFEAENAVDPDDDIPF